MCIRDRFSGSPQGWQGDEAGGRRPAGNASPSPYEPCWPPWPPPDDFLERRRRRRDLLGLRLPSLSSPAAGAPPDSGSPASSATSPEVTTVPERRRPASSGGAAAVRCARAGSAGGCPLPSLLPRGLPPSTVPPAAASLSAAPPHGASPQGAPPQPQRLNGTSANDPSGMRRVSDSLVSWKPTTTPSPDSVCTFVPRFGTSLRKHTYCSCSYLRQHINRPHSPEIFMGLSGRFCSLAMRMDTGSWSPWKREQQRSRPHGPRPPRIRVSSRAPI